jgi:hypothetical protein
VHARIASITQSTSAIQRKISRGHIIVRNHARLLRSLVKYNSRPERFRSAGLDLQIVHAMACAYDELQQQILDVPTKQRAIERTSM